MDSDKVSAALLEEGDNEIKVAYNLLLDNNAINQQCKTLSTLVFT